MDFKERLDVTIAKQFKVRSPASGNFGIEIETEGDGLFQGQITDQFQGHPDGSLRNGMEFVSVPLPLGDVPGAVNHLANTLGRMGVRLAPTYRSSTHIHVNFCDRTLKDLLGLMILWATLEPIFMRLMPKGRDGSLFCMSSYDCGDLAEYVDHFCTDILNGFSRGFRPRGKYSSLNITRLAPWDGARGLGTVEFRIFPSSMDGQEIAKWCGWLQRLVDIVTEYKADDGFIGLVREAEQNPLPLVERVFGEFPLPAYDIPGYVDFGARSAYEVALVVNKFYKKKPKTTKKTAAPAEAVMMDDIMIVDDQPGEAQW